MGNFLETLGEITKTKPLTNPNLGNSIAKLREYYGSFKNTCDTYSIDLTQFDNIFSSNETSFKIWDTDNNGYIDALELFSGLILFSDAQFDQKLKFLFDIFDFNELNVLGLIDLQFMIICCCNSTYKIYGHNISVEEDYIGEFLNNYFSSSAEINIETLIQFTKKIQEVYEFCKFIDKIPPEQTANLEVNLLQINSFADDEDSNLFTMTIKHEPQQLGQVSKSRDYQIKMNFVEHMADKLYVSNQKQNEEESQSNQRDVNIGLNWVFGFKCRGLKQPLEYYNSKRDGQKAENQKIIYFSGCIAIVYYIKLYEQKHYIEHDYEIISIAQAKTNSLVATGELAAKPSLHIWDSNTLQNYGVINGIHRNGIHLIQFFKNDDYIVSCGMRENSQILIYNVKDLSLVLSTFIDNFATELQTIKNYTFDIPGSNKNQSVYKNKNNMNKSIISNQSLNTTIVEHEFFDYERAFLVCSDSQFILFLIHDGNFITNEFDLEMFSVTEQLLCATAYKVKTSTDQTGLQNGSGNENSIIIATGHRGGEVILWENLDIQQQGKAYTDKDILQIATFEHGLIIGDSAGVIHIWDFLMKNNSYVCDISMDSIINDQLALINLHIHSILGYDSTLIVISEEGDTIFIDTEIEGEEVKIRNIQRNNFITKLKGEFKAMCLLERNENDQDQQNNIKEFQLGTQNNIVEKQVIQQNDSRIYCIGMNSTMQGEYPLQISIVYGFSLEMHQIVSMWEFEGELITSIDCIYHPIYKQVFAIGCFYGKIIFRKCDLNQQGEWIDEECDEFEDKQSELPNQIMQIKFSPDQQHLVAITSTKNIIVFEQKISTDSDKNQIKYTKKECKELEGKEIPITLDFVDDSKSILIGTHSRNQYKIDLSNLNQKNITQDQEKINCTVWNLSYPLTKEFNPEDPNSEIFLPTLISSDNNIYLMADNTGYIYLWKDKLQLQQNSGSMLRGHTSRISQLLMTKSQNYFYSLGENDYTLLEWKITNKSDLNMTNFQNQDDQKNNINDVALPKIYNEIQLPQLINLNDQILIRELMYCSVDKMNIFSQNLNDSFVYFKGVNDKAIHQLYSNQINKYTENELVHKRPPAISMSIDYIYGFHCYDRRNTIFYVHKYFMSSQNVNNLDKKSIAQKKAQELEIQQGKKKGQKVNIHSFPIDEEQQQEKGQPSIMIPAFLQKEMLYAQRSLLPYQDTHQDCQRHFVYFISRIAIVLNPLTNKQEYYEGHSNKISCLAIHPLKFFIATGEVSQSPTIHIWNCLNCQTFKIIQTHHSNGIMMLSFSRDASLLISVGIDKYYSIQVTNWKSEEILAFRNSGGYPIFDVQFNPYDKYQFVTSGTKNITFWEISAKNLMRQKVVNILENYQTTVVITCLQFISYSLGEIIQSDIIAGNNNGDLILVVSGKYIIAKEKAHQKMINVIKIIELFKDKVLIITAAEDEWIRIWDTQFSLISEISIRKNTGFYFESSPSSLNVSAQSIDIFSCKYPKKINEQNIEDTDSNVIYPILLIGTRNGDIIEASFQIEYTGLKQQIQKAEFKKKSKNRKQQNLDNDSQSSGSNDSESSSESEEDNYNNQGDEQAKDQEEKNQQNILKKHEQYGQQDLFKFNYQIYIRGHASQQFDPQQRQKKVQFTLHPKEKILVSIGDDYNLIFQNLGKNKLLLMQQLKQLPTAIQYSPCGRFIVIGFVNGTVQIIQTIFEGIHKQGHSQNKGDKQYNYSIPTLETLQKFEDTKAKQKHPVIAIKFSSDYRIFAVSYGNTSQKSEMNSYVLTFVMTNDLQDIPKQQDKDIKLYQIHQKIELDKTKIPRQDLHNVAVTMITFTKDSRYILLYYQNVEKYLLRDNQDNQGFIVIRDRNTNEIQQGKDVVRNSFLDGMNFPNNLIANYYTYNNLLVSDQQKLDDIPRDNLVPTISAMKNLEDLIIAGSIKGDIYFVKNSCLGLEEDQQHFDNNINKEQKMSLAKSYSALSSPISQIEMHNDLDHMFTSGQTDECIIKWDVKFEDQTWDNDNLNYQNDNLQDPYGQVVTQDTFKNLIQEVLIKRQDVTEANLNQNQDNYGKIRTELQLINILGRKAFTRHSNLFYDFDERLVYVSGCNLVLHYIKDEEDDQNPDLEEEEGFYNEQMQPNDIDDDEERYLKQEFINLDQSENSTHAEISCFSLSKDKKIIVAGTIQINARILIWDICSRTCLKILTLTNCVIIQEVKFAYDNRHIVVLGITESYSIMLYLIDTHNSQILGCANFPYSITFKIKDIQMFPNSTNKFVACGVQYMAIWNLQGSILTYRNLQIDDPSNFQVIQQPGYQKFYDENDRLKITFMTCIFINGTILSAGDDGYLYVWDENKIVKKQNAHPNHAILSLNASQDTLFVSGGSDGKVIIWELGSSEYSYILEKVYEFDLSFNASMEINDNPEIQVQSVCIGSKYILAGTKSGDIYEQKKPDENDQKAVTKVNKDLVKLRYNCSDQEITQSLQFSGNSSKFYTLTKQGLFSVWSVKTCNRLFTRHFQKNALTMIVCKKRQYIIIAFEQEIIFLDSSQTKSNNAYPVHEKTYQYQAKIADVKLSFNEKFLAVALDTNKEQNAKIELYQATNDKEIFTELNTIPNITNSLQFIDFSIDNFFLMYKDQSEEVQYIDISNLNNIKYANTEYDMEWHTNGLLISDKTKGVTNYYSDEATEKNLLNIVKLNESTIAVTDEIGTIRLFNYPCLSGQDSGYMACYYQHLNQINACILSPDKKYLLTCSKIDKCIFLWRILQKEQDFEDELDDEDLEEEENEDELENQENNSMNDQSDHFIPQNINE